MSAKRSLSDSDLLFSARRQIDRLCEVLDGHEAELSASKGNAHHAAQGLQAVGRAIESARRAGINAELALKHAQRIEVTPAESLAKADSNE